MSAPIAIAAAADDLYAMPLAVTARSVADSRGAGAETELFLLDAGIRPANRRRIERSLDVPGMAVHWIDATDERLRRIARHNPLGYPAAALCRLELGRLLPERVERIAYLDSDMVCVADLKPLFDLDLKACWAAAVGEYNASRNRGGAVDDGIYYNTGLLLIDMPVWRANDAGSMAMAALKNEPARCVFPDQDAINLTLRDHLYRLDGRWNQLPDLLLGTPDDGLYSDVELDQIRTDPYVIHFASSTKPWHRSCAHPQRDRWFDVLDRTAWAGWRPTAPRIAVNKVRRIKRRAINKAAAALSALPH